MKNVILSKLSCAAMIGLLLPMSVANASDPGSERVAFRQLETYP